MCGNMCGYLWLYFFLNNFIYVLFFVNLLAFVELINLLLIIVDESLEEVLSFQSKAIQKISPHEQLIKKKQKT